jgi:hypothetical protein
VSRTWRKIMVEGEDGRVRAGGVCPDAVPVRYSHDTSTGATQRVERQTEAIADMASV